MHQFTVKYFISNGPFIFEAKEYFNIKFLKDIPDGITLMQIHVGFSSRDSDFGWHAKSFPTSFTQNFGDFESSIFDDAHKG